MSHSRANGKLVHLEIDLILAAFPASFPAFKPVAASLEAITKNGAVEKREFAQGRSEKEPSHLEDNSLPSGSNLFVTVRYADGHEVRQHIGHIRENGEPVTVQEAIS